MDYETAPLWERRAKLLSSYLTIISLIIACSIFVVRFFSEGDLCPNCAGQSVTNSAGGKHVTVYDNDGYDASVPNRLPEVKEEAMDDALDGYIAVWREEGWKIKNNNGRWVFPAGFNPYVSK